MPLNDSTDPFGGAVNLESLPLIGIERIEIARGPMSFYRGSAALAGSKNVLHEDDQSILVVGSSPISYTSSL